MQKTKIEWVKNPDGTQGYVWNPIQGLCPVACRLPDKKIYCYGINNYVRFNRLPQIRFDYGIYKKIDTDKWCDREKRKGIFVCSTFEIFHPITLTPFDGKITWRDMIFRTIQESPQHRFYILTKLPQNIDRPMPPNVWLGVSITKDEDMWRRNRLVTTDAKPKFISFEPLLEKIDPMYGLLRCIDWVIIGRLTKHGNKHDPTKRQLNRMVLDIRRTVYSPPIFLKDNLKDIWGEPLIQEMPK